jgi:hypothetical protein
MGTWLDQYLAVDELETWTILFGAGTRYRDDPDFEDRDDVVEVVRETMRRARRNIERLATMLPAAGWRFRDPSKVLIPPSEGIEASLDGLEGEIGRLPLSLRVWLEEVGVVSLAGYHPSWGYDLIDYLEVDTSVAAIRRQYAYWQSAIGRGRKLPFTIAIAPDYLHKNDVGGGAAYSMVAPDDNIDGILWNEYHQTTFVNYLRIAFSWGGLLGWDRPGPPLERYQSDPPQALRDIARSLERI